MTSDIVPDSTSDITFEPSDLIYYISSITYVIWSDMLSDILSDIYSNITSDIESDI